MHVLVLGAGVVGVTTAYYLAQHGCEVTVIDRAHDVADAASYGNAGQLSYSFTDALARPSFLAKLPGLVLGRQPGSRVHLEPRLIPWGLSFITQCTPRHARENTIAVLRTAMRSAELLDELCSNAKFDFSHRAAGKLVLLADQAELRTAEANCELKKSHGCETTIVSRDEAIAIEPAIADMHGNVLAAVYSRSDEVADSRSFTDGLRGWLEQTGKVRFLLDSTVEGLVFENDKAVGVTVDGQPLGADAVCVCMGAWSNSILRSAGINPKIYPVRGYSLTLPPGDSAPSVSVTALQHRMVFSRINGHVRVAGFADFMGFDTSADDERTRDLFNLARRFAPKAARYAVPDAKRWGGFRPMTPNGRPRVGATGVRGLFMNTGHGMLGWTLACASSYDAANAIVEAN